MYSEDTVNKLNIAYACVEYGVCVMCMGTVYMCGYQTEDTYSLSHAHGILKKFDDILDHKENLNKSQKEVYRPLSLTTIPERG